MPLIIKVLPASLCLFLGIFPLFFACGNSNTSQAETIRIEPCSCIAAVIAADAEAGKTRNHACEGQPLSQTITEYAEAIISLDYSGCPADFKQAMLRHADTWNDLLTFTDQYPDLRGEMHDLFNELKSGPGGAAFSSQVDEVWATWAEVEEAVKICGSTK